MAFTIVVAQQKGGAGKTTLVCHLAAELLCQHTASGQRLRVATIDLHPQNSLSFWAQNRRNSLGEEESYRNFRPVGHNIRSEVAGLSEDYDVIIIDTPPHPESVSRHAMQFADVVLIPMQLSPFDLHATAPVAALTAREERASLLVCNRVPPRSRCAAEIRASLKDVGVPLAKSALGARTLFAHSIKRGFGVTELAPSSPAAGEVRALRREVMRWADGLCAEAA